MKTNRFKLLASMVILAAAITTTSPIKAQRSQNRNNRTETRVQGSDIRRNFRSTQNKISTKKVEPRKVTSRSTANRTATNKAAKVSNRITNPNNRVTKPNVNSTKKSTQNRSVITTRKITSNGRNAVRNMPQRIEKSEASTRKAVQSRSSSTTLNSSRSGRNITIGNQSGTHGTNVARNSTINATRRTTGINSKNTREMYRLDENDKRYIPNKDYRGSTKVWTNKRRPETMNYNGRDRNYYRNYDYRLHKNWDRSWERYRWNFYSWRDYYRGYNPYSYRYQRYYYYNPVYGHVIRKFVFRPNIFIHNYKTYYCYDGHFFRFLRGVGYVLVDIPFGMTFDTLPYGYERVYINGYLYFRVDNLFFELTNSGFRLVYYPERYYAYDGYIKEGYHFQDDLYY